MNEGDSIGDLFHDLGRLEPLVRRVRTGSQLVRGSTKGVAEHIIFEIEIAGFHIKGIITCSGEPSVIEDRNDMLVATAFG